MFGIPDDGKMIQGSKRVPDEAMPGCVKPAYLRKIAAARRKKLWHPPRQQSAICCLPCDRAN